MVSICYLKALVNLYKSVSSTWKYALKWKRYNINHPEMFLGEGALKICIKFTGEHPCRSVISIKLKSNFIEITLRHGCSPVTLLHIFRTTFPKNISGGVLLKILDFHVPWNFKPIWTCFDNIIRKVKKTISLTCIPKHVSAVVMKS